MRSVTAHGHVLLAVGFCAGVAGGLLLPPAFRHENIASTRPLRCEAWVGGPQPLRTCSDGHSYQRRPTLLAGISLPTWHDAGRITAVPQVPKGD